jgi:hypothetical protein
MKKVFGGLNITWPKLIIWAIIVGIYTAVMAMLPITSETSFRDIAISFEVWILFGVLIITNSKSPLESALKCFVFFLISQPLVYLVQILCGSAGWSLFGYYYYWFIWTIACLPMGYIGYYMRNNEWWGLLILTPILLLLIEHYFGFLNEAVAFFPNHLLSAIFCAVTMLIYSWYIFDKKELRIIETTIALLLIVGATVYIFVKPKEVYNTQFGIEDVQLTADTKAWLDDSKYGELKMIYIDSLEDYLIDASFTNTGDTKINVDTGEVKCVGDITIKRHSYEVTNIKCE